MTRSPPPLSIEPQVKRARLTKKERKDMANAQNGLCGCGCGDPLAPNGKGDVGEHVWHFVALGNDEKPDKLYRPACAKKKTNGPRGDINTIAHVKRLAEGRTQYDWRQQRGPKLKNSRGFDKSLRKKLDGTVLRNG